MTKTLIEFASSYLNLEAVNMAQSLLMLLLPVMAGRLSAQSDWDEPFPPHRIADSLYYVGSKGLASYLITTSKGHILINSSFDLPDDNENYGGRPRICGGTGNR